MKKILRKLDKALNVIKIDEVSVDFFSCVFGMKVYKLSGSLKTYFTKYILNLNAFISEKIIKIP